MRWAEIDRGSTIVANHQAVAAVGLIGCLSTPDSDVPRADDTHLGRISGKNHFNFAIDGDRLSRLDARGDQRRQTVLAEMQRGL